MMIIKRDIGRPTERNIDIKKIINDTDLFTIECLVIDTCSRYLVNLLDANGYHECSYEYLEECIQDSKDIEWLYNHKGNITDDWDAVKY